MCQYLYIFIEKELKLMGQKGRESLENEWKKRRAVGYSQNRHFFARLPEEGISVQKKF